MTHRTSVSAQPNTKQFRLWRVMQEADPSVASPSETESQGRSKLRLGEWKEFLPIGLAAFSILYGIGWALQYQAACRLGVGPVGVSREAAMATVVALIGLIFPSAVLGVWLEWALKNLKGTRVYRWTGISVMGVLFYGFSAFLICGIPLMMGNAPADLRTRAFAFLMLAFVVVSVFFLVRALIKIQIATAVFGLVALVGLTQTFSDSVLEKLPEALGGPGTSKVAVQVKDPAQVITATLLMSDDKFLILKDAEIKAATGAISRTGVCRLAIDRVLEIRPASKAP